MSCPLLPSGRRRGLPFTVPDHWTPEQARAVSEVREDLLAFMTDFYGAQLNELLREQRSSEARTRTHRRDPPF